MATRQRTVSDVCLYWEREDTARLESVLEAANASGKRQSLPNSPHTRLDEITRPLSGLFEKYGTPPDDRQLLVDAVITAIRSGYRLKPTAEPV